MAVDSGRRTITALEKVAQVLTVEQLEQLAELLLMTKDLAILRKSDQSVTIVFNDKGLPRGFNASNNVRPVKPCGYRAE